MTDDREWADMAVVGRVARPHGIRGQVVVNPETDFPEERFAVGATLFTMRGGRIEPFTVTAFRMQNARPVVAFESVGDMDAARDLAGLELRVPQESLVSLPEGTYYHHDLVGCEVELPDGRTVGTVSKVEGEMGSTRLVVEAGTNEVLIPLARDICTAIDTAAKRIVIDPPEGLIELNERRS